MSAEKLVSCYQEAADAAMDWLYSKRCVACFLLVNIILSTAVATPVTVIEIESYDDPWDYKLEPHHEPIMKESTKNHMPALPRRTAKSQDVDIEEEYDLQDLEGPSSSIGPKLTCASCKLGVTLLRREVEKNETVENIKEKFVGVCVGLKIEVETVCEGAFNLYGEVVLPALKVCNLETQKICSLLLGEACGDIDNPLHDWDIDLDEGPEKNIWDSPPPAEDVPVFKVLHISDTHYDPQYEEGSPANCEEPLCCRSYSSEPEDGSKIIPAGKWGSYGKCDAPAVLIDNMLENIVKQHPDIDYVIWTGDIPPHDVWNQTRTQNIDNIRYTGQSIFDAFPNVPIFPALGNHEGIPAGNFPPPWIQQENQSVAWLLDVVSDEWNKWLPNEVNATIVHGGFYSVLVRPKFRIIAINTNYCYALSWWLVLNSTDPAHELKWLVHELQSAEDKGEKVHIIGHIPPGSADCLKIWSKNYYNIINRYKDTVVAQFFGHTHSDEFEVFYDNVEFQNATAVAFIGPSVTTFEHLNPGYRIYYVDGDHEKSTREVIDHETWIMDLAKANAHPENDPEWFKLYSARDSYGMLTLRPEEWARLIDLMVTDPKLFDLFYRYLYKSSPVRPPCDDKCKFRTICDLKSGKSHNRHILCQREEDILLPRSKPKV